MQISGNKSYFLKARYKKFSHPIITNSLPPNWKPECCMLEGMFLINTYPLSHHKTLADYSSFLLRRFVHPLFSKGSSEVHIVLTTLES